MRLKRQKFESMPRQEQIKNNNNLQKLQSRLDYYSLNQTSLNITANFKQTTTSKLITKLISNNNNNNHNNLTTTMSKFLLTTVVVLILAIACSLNAANASQCQYLQQQQLAANSHQQQHHHSSANNNNQLLHNDEKLVMCAKPPAQMFGFNGRHALSPQVELQQQRLLQSLNVSLTNYLPLSPTSIQNQNQLDEMLSNELIGELVSPSSIDAAYSEAKLALIARRKFEAEMAAQGLTTDMSKPTAVARHQKVTTTTTRGNELEKAQEVFEEMSKILAKNLTQSLNTAVSMQQASSSNNDNSNTLSARADDALEAADSMQLLARVDLSASEARHAVSRCEEDAVIECDPNFPYRHADGRCNNLAHPTWGKSNTCFARLLPPDYSDGQSAPRISVTGQPLPNPRILSAIVHRDFNYPATYTHFVMQYGQFFAHDIAFTPSSRTKTGQMIQCCPLERDLHPQCFPILVPPDDPFYSNWDENCLNFVRTAVCPRCRLGPREQMNQITSFIDGSQVYGAAANETAALWTKSGPAGRMHVSLDDNGRELLPHSADPSNDQCSDVDKNQFCYRAGDRRVNQHPALTSVHVMWLRQHNRIVNGLKMVNPHWNGDRLYQEAKRISTAQMQMVTYNEWLSLIIGQEAMKFLKLNVLPTGYTQYDPTVDPTLLNEFSGAAFRFGHSMINNIFAEILPDGRPSGYRLNEFFFHPFGLRLGQHDMVMRGLISQASQNRDPFVSSDIKNHLYRPRDNPYGLDLPAFNIQRGRDHGIPGYTKLVEFCFDDRISNWKQLDQYMPVSQRIRFSKLYRSVHDLDLFSAGLAEYPLPGAALGPTFTCIVGIQMFNLKYGDRFWFEHGSQVGSFTPNQLQEIRKTNLARLVCANSDNINIVQRNVFRGESPTNPSVSCSSLPDTDLKAWREMPGTKSAFSHFASDINSPTSNTNVDSSVAARQARHTNGSRNSSYSTNSPANINQQKLKQPSLGSSYALIKPILIVKTNDKSKIKKPEQLGNEYANVVGNQKNKQQSQTQTTTTPSNYPHQSNNKNNKLNSITANYNNYQAPIYLNQKFVSAQQPQQQVLNSVPRPRSRSRKLNGRTKYSHQYHNSPMLYQRNPFAQTNFNTQRNRLSSSSTIRNSAGNQQMFPFFMQQPLQTYMSPIRVS